MAWFFNPWASVGYALMVAAWGLAIVLLFSGHPTRQTRMLVLLLVAEGFIGTGGFGLIWSTPSAGEAFAWQITSMCAAMLAAAFYLTFISTIDTPLGRPFRSRGVRVALVAGVAAMVAFFAMRPELLVSGMFRVWWNAWEPLPGARWSAVWTATSLVSLYGLAAAWDARRRTAAGSEARRRATLYFAAFGVRDVAWVLLYLTTPLWFHRAGAFSDAFILVLAPGASLAFCVLLAYGVLRAQLFDIDLRVRRGIRGGTVAGAFLAVFLVASQLIENVTSDALGLVAGSLAAGLLLFALVPLQRAAERLAGAAVPSERVSPEYLAFRKLEVYKAAVESAIETGGVTQKERLALDRLREKLRLDARDAAAVEADALAPLPAPA